MGGISRFASGGRAYPHTNAEKKKATTVGRLLPVWRERLSGLAAAQTGNAKQAEAEETDSCRL